MIAMILTSEKKIEYMKKSCPAKQMKSDNARRLVFSLWHSGNEVYIYSRHTDMRLYMLCCSSPPRIKTGIAFFRFLLIISSTEKGKGRRQIDLSRHTSFVRRLRLRSTLRSLKRIVGIMFNGRRLWRLRFSFFKSL